MTLVTQILCELQKGDRFRSEELLPLVYEELRKLAAQRIGNEAVGHSLQGTALVHEAYLRLVGAAQPQLWESRGHFFAAAAEAMRRILIEHARTKKRAKHGGGRRRIDLNAELLPTTKRMEELVAVDEVLDQLAAEDPAKADLVKLRYFAGCTIEEAAELLGISPATAKRHWTYARAWLFKRVSDGRHECTPKSTRT